MRRNPFIFIAGIMLIFTMTGCPYESPVPLGNSCSSSVATELLGKWVYPSATGKSDTVEFIQFNEHEFFIEFRENKEGGIRIISKGRGFITVVKNQRILNFCELGSPVKYYFFKYEVKNNRMITWSPSDKFIKKPFNSSEELLEYFKKNMDRKEFYGAPDTAVHVK
jgi:hypothetical protein